MTVVGVSDGNLLRKYTHYCTSFLTRRNEPTIFVIRQKQLRILATEKDGENFPNTARLFADVMKDTVSGYAVRWICFSCKGELRQNYGGVCNQEVAPFTSNLTLFTRLSLNV